MALLMQSTGTEMLHVPYKGTAGAVTDLLGGRIDYMFLPVHVALQHIQAGKLKAIATGSDKRLAQLPDVPTLAEAGITGRQRRHVVRRARAQGHARRGRRAPQQGDRRGAEAARGRDRFRVAGHGAGGFDAGRIRRR